MEAARLVGWTEAAKKRWVRRLGYRKGPLESNREAYDCARQCWKIGQRLTLCLINGGPSPCPGCERCEGTGVVPARRVRHG